jgi:ABC-2 type transport system permease protein
VSGFLHRLGHLLRKEFTQVFRDRRLRVFIFVPPVLQLLIFGYAANMDVRHLKLAVLDRAQTQETSLLVDRFRHSGYFEPVAMVDKPADLNRLFDENKVTVALALPASFSADLAAGRTVEVQVILDGTDSLAAQVAADYASQIILGFGQDRLKSRMEVAKGFLDYDSGDKIKRLMAGVEPVSRVWYNPNLSSRNFFIPGIVALILSIMTLMLTSMSVVREREMGTLEQLLVTPITPGEFILGKTIPFALIGFAQATLVLIVGKGWFHVPFVGHLGLFYLAVGLYVTTSLGLGLLISTVSRTQQQALTTSFLVLFPAILFSGFMFPIANMPPVIQWLTYLNPLRYFITILRDVFLKGSSVGDLLLPLAALAVMGPAVLAAAAARVRRGLG